MGQDLDETDFENYDDHHDLQSGFLRSFFVVVGGILIANSWIPVLILLLVIFFPNAASKFSEAPITQETSLVDEFPTVLFVVAPFVLALSAFLGGHFAARLSPAAKMGHGVLIAAVLLLQSFQAILSEQSFQPQWFILLAAVIGPFAAIFGALFAQPNTAFVEDQETADLPNTPEDPPEQCDSN